MTTEVKYHYFNWGPFLFHSTVPKELCTLLKAQGDKSRGDKSKNYVSKLAGHLKEEYKIDYTEDIAKYLKRYLEAYSIGYNQWRGQGSMKPEATLMSMWINYQKKGEFNPPHDHGGDISFIVYVDIPDQITQECKAFEGNMRGPGGVSWTYGDGNKQCISVVHQLPKTGDIFIFPAMLKHYVFPFQSDVTRISVSGNILFNQDTRHDYMGPVKDE
jgi:hypothetical protein